MGVVMCCSFMRFYPWLFKSQRILPYCEPSEFSSWQAAAPAGISDCTKQLTWPDSKTHQDTFYQILSDSIRFYHLHRLHLMLLEKHGETRTSREFGKMTEPTASTSANRLGKKVCRMQRSFFFFMRIRPTGFHLLHGCLPLKHFVGTNLEIHAMIHATWVDNVDMG